MYLKLQMAHLWIKYLLYYMISFLIFTALQMFLCNFIFLFGTISESK